MFYSLKAMLLQLKTYVLEKSTLFFAFSSLIFLYIEKVICKEKRKQEM